MKLARHAPTLLVLGLVALAPFLALVWKLPMPVDVPTAKGAVRTVWVLTPLLWFAQLALVGAVAAVLDPELGVIAGARAAARGLAIAAVPCALAIGAIAVGLVALVVPGLLLIVLFAVTGAVVTDDSSSALAASAATVRGRIARVALIVGGALVLDAAIVFVAQHLLLDIPAKPSGPQLATFATFRRIVTLGLVIATPIVATALATIARAARR